MEDTDLGESFSEETESLVASSEVPVEVHVEVGKTTMSLKEILQMKPGNMLTLDVKPEHPVTLVVQGKPFAKAELLKVGDVLGVRILKLAK